MRAAALLCLVLVLAGCGGSSKPRLDGTALSSTAPSFTLHDQAGAAVSLHAQRGRYVVVTFLYTHCPDVCPVIAGTLNRVLETPVARRARLRVLAVSVDPKRDTPAAVDHFVRVHRLVPAFRYLTGTRAQLKPVWKAFHIASTPGPNGTVSHSAFEILIDPQGRERLLYDSNVTSAAVVHDLSALLGE
jgi:protein SCO1/2